jgi:hypothetical protein
MLYIWPFSIQGRLGSFWVVIILGDLGSKIRARMNQHQIWILSDFGNPGFFSSLFFFFLFWLKCLDTGDFCVFKLVTNISELFFWISDRQI